MAVTHTDPIASVVLAWCYTHNMQNRIVCHRGVGLDAWRRGLEPPDNTEGPPVARPTTWLLTTGWCSRGGGRIDTELRQLKAGPAG